MRISDWSSDVCSPDLEGSRQVGTAHGRVLNHDGNIDCRGQAIEELMDLALAAPYGSPVIGRQEHDHGGAMIQRVLVARHADIGAVMRGRDNDGDAAGQDRKSTRLNSSN